MDRDDLAFAGVVSLAGQVREGQVSSRELVELFLERIGRLDPALNAFRIVMAERALADAGQADARRRGGDARPLLGVPLAVKDTEDLAGEVTRWGTAAFSEPATRDGELVSRLRAAGAVFIGKTNLPELAIIGVHRGSGLWHHAQPLGPGRHAGRVERRERGRRGRGTRARRHRVGRRRVDPHPGGELRAGGAEAAARQDSARPAHRALVRDERARLRGPHCGRFRPAARRGRGSRGRPLRRPPPPGRRSGYGWPCRPSPRRRPG